MSRALQIRNRVVSDVAIPLEQVRVVEIAADSDGPTVEAIKLALVETGYSRFPVVDSGRRFVGYVHIKDILPAVDDPEAVVDRSTVRPLPEVSDAMPLPDALTRHAAQQRPPCPGDRAGRRVVAIVALEDLVEDLVGTVRDGTHRV